jgi:hypothetical protein
MWYFGDPATKKDPISWIGFIHFFPSYSMDETPVGHGLLPSPSQMRWQVGTVAIEILELNKW